MENPLAGKQKRAEAARIVLLLLALAGNGCGLLGEKGEEPMGDAFLPLSGVGPYLKEDQDCEADFTQSIFMTSADPDIFWGEPLATTENGVEFRLFFEARSPAAPRNRLRLLLQRMKIVVAPPNSCRTRDISFLDPSGATLADPAPSVLLDENGDPVQGGAPSVLAEGGIFKIWYTREDGSGIGYAEFREQPDGDLRATGPDELVLAPSEPWEGNYVGSPSVLKHPRAGVYQMWYEGGTLTDGTTFCSPRQDICHPNAGQDLCSRAIGYAVSGDGIHWVKQDPSGRNSTDHPGQVTPVLTASQLTWEFHYPAEPHSGTLGTPYVLLHTTPTRVLYYMYYTGNLQSTPGPDPCSDVDSSIGFAGSKDGVHWVKSSTIQQFGDIAWEVNPILNEVFPLDVINRTCVDFFETMEPGYRDKIQGSSNVFCPPVIVNEVTPGALDLRTSFLMFFQQFSLPDQKGLGLAVVERVE